ncbi:MAG TPA: intradiol ring-cleavage dioxygenase [Rugosimonospora sp.]|nr:intradiol ring-cleavage dioxygenase [Rugosimonospora sp.]
MARHREDSGNDAYVRRVHDRGLRFDLGALSRRRILAALGGAGALAAAGGEFLVAGGSAQAADCTAEIESETAGPYPADGTNGVDIRTGSGIVRSDIRTSFGTGNTAPGIPLTISLTIEDLSCQPLTGAAVYLWHCDRDGEYSLYSTAIVNEDYLRGIQQADSTGTVSFTSIFPGCYAGRWPHIHVEVYSSLTDATSGRGQIRKTSQIALPQDVATEVYATTGYSASVTNLSKVTLGTDSVFGDDAAAREMATVTGSVSGGLTARLRATVDPTAVQSANPRPTASPLRSGNPVASGNPVPGGSAQPTAAPQPTGGGPTTGQKW